ncbi:50S ribosomal protein L30 [Spirochaeta cellobiosiphila]|uniref:50S ribosomal protein L30 n=1 Tax=Spirochaeta cellobiosiphila TaxID=504483 RepID=UPI0004183DCF|nr:50S ribosomal protein L30 [Spirochaeta cellobiosiphila]
MAKAKVKKVRVRLVRSIIGRIKTQKRTVKALGLGKIGSVVEKEVNPAIQGMINSISHLVEVEEIV